MGIFLVTSGLQGISGSVAITGQPGLNVFTSGLQGVSGTVSTLPTGGTSVYTSGQQSVSGSVNVYTSGLQGISGSISITNWPATINVSGSVSTTPPTGGTSVFTTGAQWVSGSISLAPSLVAGSYPNFTGSIGQLPGGTLAVGLYKASPGLLYKVQVNNRSTGSIYLQFFNTTSSPTLGSIPFSTILVTSGSSGGPAQFDAMPFGAYLSNGIAIGLSSSPNTYVPIGNYGANSTGTVINADTTVQWL
jgi:hypothetical protein